MDHTCSNCRYEAKPEEFFWHNGVLYRTCNLHREGAEGNQVISYLDSFARVLRQNINNQVGSWNESASIVKGFTFHVNFFGIIENLSAQLQLPVQNPLLFRWCKKFQEQITLNIVTYHFPCCYDFSIEVMRIDLWDSLRHNNFSKVKGVQVGHKFYFHCVQRTETARVPVSINIGEGIHRRCPDSITRDVHGIFSFRISCKWISIWFLLCWSAIQACLPPTEATYENLEFAEGFYSEARIFGRPANLRNFQGKNNRVS
jgi:hypothetical protein